MPCIPMRIDARTVAIVCTRTRRPARPPKCVGCGIAAWQASMRYCDAPIGKKGNTCDAAVCTDCAHHVEPDTDYCPRHVPKPVPAQMQLDGAV